MMTEFGNWVRASREQQGLTQTECAARAGMKLQQWNRMEKQITRPEYDTLMAVADALRAPVDDALRAANYTVHNPSLPSMRLAQQIEAYLSQAPAAQRPALAAAALEMVRVVVGVAVAA